MRRLPSRSTRTATLLPDTTLFRSAVRGLGGARVGGGEIAMKDLEVGNGEPSQRVGPRREQRTHDDVADTVPVDLGGTAVVVADRRRETGFDPPGETVLGGLDIGRDRGVATLSARVDLDTERKSEVYLQREYVRGKL